MPRILDGLPSYRPYGQPAYGYVVIKTIPNQSDTVTINGDVYTYGVDFTGTVPARVAQGLCAAINSDISVQELNTQMLPVRPYAAYYYQNSVFIYATAPGVVGNGMTLATSNSDAFSLPSSTLANGVDANSTVSRGTLTDRSGTITTGGTAQVLAAANPSRRYLIIQNMSSDILYVDFDGTAAVVGQPSLAIPTPNGAIVFESSFVPVGAISIIGATTADAFSAKEA